MAYAIIRIAKLGSAGAVGAAGEHIHRLRHTPNADPELLRYNKRLVGSTDLIEDVSARLEAAGIAPRKNAVLAVEHLITASPEFFDYEKYRKADGSVGLRGRVERWAEFEQRTLTWLQKCYGAENVVNVVAHKDEKTPHLHAVVVPIVSKEIALTRKTKKAPERERRTATKTVLAARELFGDRVQLRDLQSSFADHMQPMGLSRGIEGSRAEHTTVRDFYRLAQDASSSQGIETAQRLLMELGNRRESKDAQELKTLKAALAEAGLKFYNGKIMSQAAAQQARQADRKAASTTQTTQVVTAKPKPLTTPKQIIKTRFIR